MAAIAKRWADSMTVAAAADACRAVPEEVSNEQAGLSTIAEIVMNGVRRSGLTRGEAVVVFVWGAAAAVHGRSHRRW